MVALNDDYYYQRIFGLSVRRKPNIYGAVYAITAKRGRGGYQKLAFSHASTTKVL